MEISWLVGAGAALVGGGLCFWIWCARRAGGARDTVSAYLIGDQMSGGIGSHHEHHHHDSGGGWGDSGASDAGGDA